MDRTGVSRLLRSSIVKTTSFIYMIIVTSYVKKRIKMQCGSYKVKFWGKEVDTWIKTYIDIRSKLENNSFSLNFLSSQKKNCNRQKFPKNSRNKGGKEGSLSADPVELGRVFTIKRRGGQCTHRHVLAPVSREGLLILEEDAVTRLPARLARCLADAALGLWKGRK